MNSEADLWTGINVPCSAVDKYWLPFWGIQSQNRALMLIETM
jgi:hypothetical protein